MQVSKQYLDFFCKQHYIKMPYKLSNDKLIFEAIENTLKSKELSKKSLCIFNSSSLLNIIRKVESNKVYLNEANQISEPSDVLKTKLNEIYSSKFKSSKIIRDNLDKCFIVDFFDKDPNSDVFGNILITCLVDLNICQPKDVLNILSRHANLMGYNYIDFEEEDSNNILLNEQVFKCCWLKIQLEALYISPNLKLGEKLYHVTTRNLAEKIVNKKVGLVPRNSNSYNFNYSPRIYCFIDRNRDLQKQYASVTGKQNKKYISNDNFDEFLKYVILQHKNTGVLVDTKEFAIIEIDTTKINNKFYRDNTFEVNGSFVAVYTTQNIPYQALKIVDIFKI